MFDKEAILTTASLSSSCMRIASSDPFRTFSVCGDMPNFVRKRLHSPIRVSLSSSNASRASSACCICSTCIVLCVSQISKSCNATSRSTWSFLQLVVAASHDTVRSSIICCSTAFSIADDRIGLLERSLSVGRTIGGVRGVMVPEGLRIGDAVREFKRTFPEALRSFFAISNSAVTSFLALADSFNSRCTDTMSSDLSFSKNFISSNALLRRTAIASCSVVDVCFSIWSASICVCNAFISISFLSFTCINTSFAVLSDNFNSSASDVTLLFSSSEASRSSLSRSRPVSPVDAADIASTSRATNLTLPVSHWSTRVILACSDSFNFIWKAAESSTLLNSDTFKSSCALTRETRVELHTSKNDFNDISMSLNSSSLLAMSTAFLAICAVSLAFVSSPSRITSVCAASASRRAASKVVISMAFSLNCLWYSFAVLLVSSLVVVQSSVARRRLSRDPASLDCSSVASVCRAILWLPASLVTFSRSPCNWSHLPLRMTVSSPRLFFNPSETARVAFVLSNCVVSSCLAASDTFKLSCVMTSLASASSTASNAALFAVSVAFNRSVKESILTYSSSLSVASSSCTTVNLTFKPLISLAESACLAAAMISSCALISEALLCVLSFSAVMTARFFFSTPNS